jgi:perosamine synthetase
VIPVHYGGQMAEMDRFRDLAEAHGLLLFEDAAQAHGALYDGRPAGSWGDAGMFSFTPLKLITTGEGAVVTTDDADLAYRMRLLRNHGMDKQYHHEILGWNWRITEMQAAMGVCQVGRLDDILAIKDANAADMADRLSAIGGVAAPVTAPGRRHPHTLYTLTLEPAHRDSLAAALEAAGIETRFYFPPVHLQPVFSTEASVDPELPVTDHLAARILSVPFHARVTSDDLAEIAAIVERVTAV